jgi:hypothetical protein
MRFYVEALRELATSKIAVMSCAAAATTLVAVTGTVMLWPAGLWPAGEPEIPADAVVVAGPLFTPATFKPPAPVPATRPSSPGSIDAAPILDDVSLTRAVQYRLKRARCYGGAIDGVWSRETRRGMSEFTGLVNARLPLDRPAPEFLALLERNESAVCLSACIGRPPEDCVPRPVPARSRDETVALDRADTPAPQTASTGPASVEPGNAETASADLQDNAGAMPAPMPGLQKATNAEPRAAKRKYKSNSFSRSVSKGFKKLQRALNSLF